jgi:hypothetical protein
MKPTTDEMQKVKYLPKNISNADSEILCRVEAISADVLQMYHKPSLPACFEERGKLFD